MKITIAVIAIVLFIWLYCLLGANKQRNKTESQSRTNYDRIMQMSTEELAKVIQNARDDICFETCVRSTGNKFCCPYSEDVELSQCEACVKKWLESEVKGDADG